MRPRLSFSPALFCASVLATFIAATAQPIEMALLKGMDPRALGPAIMSGRVTAVAVERSNPRVIYLGSASGGLWKSGNGGLTWTPIFDTLAVASIGAIAIDPRNPDVLWVGTGEGNPRNSQTFGDGVYRSPDGGRSWIHMGLDRTRAIHRIIVDPENSDVVYAAVLGASWGAHPERGVFKTMDGGRTWKKILYANEETGAADLVMDPVNPRKLVAALWQYRRWPWFLKSGGPGSGLYVTVDGGDTWTRRTEKNGLPKGELGRIGIAIARSKPERMYALIETEKNALYRSDDGGFSWDKVTDRNFGGRPFYYHELYVDPRNENRVYSIHTRVSLSEDGGTTFRTLPMRIHVDHHAWYIHPDDPDFLIDGNDGGAAISHDRGRTWRFVENLPLGQFYHIDVDLEIPYNVYGGLQDNGGWMGPAYLYRHGPVGNCDWKVIGGGDGFDVLPDRSNSRFCYAMSQGGALYRRDLKTGLSKSIRPVHPDGILLRFNWNAGLAQDPFEPGTIYYGSQFLHRSTNRGDSWEVISPDLTTNDSTKQRQMESGGLTYDVTAAENHTTILTVAPSPLQKGVIWVGTDDGNLQLTRDGGKSWTNMVRNVRGVPESTWVPQIRPSPHAPGEAFVVFDNHRRNDWTPYVYRTKDFGQTWTRLADGSSVRGFALSIVQDPIVPDLLFLGTEFGLYMSIDAGKTWNRWTAGLPTVSTMDLAIHPREHDLVIGTFGRSVYIVDDIRPLREIARSGGQLLASPLHIFEPPEAILTSYESGGAFEDGDGAFRGENRPYGARLRFIANPPDSARRRPLTKAGHRDSSTLPSDTAVVTILTMEGELLRTLRTKVEPGINAVVWGLDRTFERMPGTPKREDREDEGFGRLPILPGTYRVKISLGRLVDSTSVTVKFDRRLPYTEKDLLAAYERLEPVVQQIRTATSAADRLREAGKAVEWIGDVIGERTDSSAIAVKKLGAAIKDSISKINAMIVDREVQGIRSDPELLQARLRRAQSYALATAWGEAPEPSDMVLRQTRNYLADVIQTVNMFFSRDWPAYREAVDRARVSVFKDYEPIRLE